MHNIAVLRLRDNQLLCYPPGAGEEPQALDSEEDVNALRERLARLGWSLCFAAPATAVRLQRVAISADEKKHLAQSLPFMLEDEVAEDIERLHFSVAELDKLDYAVAICQREEMTAWQALLEPLGSVPAWVPEPLLLPWQEGEWCLLLEGDRAVLRTGACEGLGCERAMLPVLLQAAAREGVPAAVVLYGSDQAADTNLLPEALRSQVQWRRGNLCSALMLVDELPPLNLRQGDFAPRLPLQRWWREWRTVAVVFAAVFCLQLLATWLDYRALAAENLSLRAAREASYRQAYPQGAVVDPEKQLQQQLNSMRGTARGGGFVSLMAQVGEVLQSEEGALLASVNYNDRGGDMRLNLLAPDFESVERIRVAINARGLVATMESSNAQNDGVRARIRVGAQG